MEDMVDYAAVRELPFTRADIARGWVLIGACAECQAGSARREQHRAIGVAPKKHRPAAAETVGSITTADQERRYPAEDVVGADFMFIDQQPYLVLMNKTKNVIHVQHVPNRSAATTHAAFVAMLTDYKRHRVERIRVYNACNPESTSEGSGSAHGVDALVTDREASFISAGLTMLAIEGIEHIAAPAGEHVGFVEKVIDIIKDRVGTMRSGLPFTVTAELLPHLVVFVVGWLNYMPRGERTLSGYTALTGRTPRYSDLMRCKFGDVLIATRQKKEIKPGMTNGAAGLCLGSCAAVPGSISFFNFATRVVVPRTRIRVCPSADVRGMFGVNTLRVPPPQYQATLRGYRQAQRQVMEPGAKTGAQPAEDNELSEPGECRVHIDGNGVVTLVPVQHNLNKGTDTEKIIDKLLTTESESGAQDGYDYRYEDGLSESGPEPVLEAASSRGGLSAISDVDMCAIAARVQAIDEAKNAEKQEQDPPVISEVRKSARFQSKDYRKQVILDAAVADGLITMIAAADGTRPMLPVPLNDGETPLDRTLVDCCAMSWRRADKERPDLSDAAHTKELTNVFITHKVCHPVHYNGTDPLHRSHDLFDIKLADDSGKSRFVVGKVIGGGEAVDVGIPLYSPTMDMKLIYTMLSVGLQNKLELSVADVSAAFLRSKMPVPGVLVLLEKHMVDRLLAMDELPRHWAAFRRKDGTMVVECDRAWYGQQSCCAIWNGEINRAIVDRCGYTRHSIVPCLYYRDVGNGEKAYIMLFVDDLGMLTARNGTEKERVTKILEHDFGVMTKQDGDRVKYVGFEIYRNRKEDRFEVTMEKRAKKLAVKQNVKVTATNPARADGSFTEQAAEDKSEPVDVTQFRSLVMSERYLTQVMPECLFHTSYLATKQASPVQKDWDDAIRVLEYMLGACEAPVLIHACGERPVLDVFTDASFQTHVDSRSHSGIAIFLGSAGAAVYCASGKQKKVTRSTCDSEIVPLELSTYTAAYFREVLQELGVDVSLVVHWEDNEAALHLVKNGTHEYSKKRKHIVGAIHSTKEYLEDDENLAVGMHCHTTMMTADSSTKDTHGSTFAFHRGSMKGHDRGEYYGR